MAEGGNLYGSGTPLPESLGVAVALATASGHTAMHGELAGYLRRAGHEATRPANPPGPWAAALAGDWRAAAAGWARLGDRYEQAVELALADDPDARAAGLTTLADLGAHAVVRVVRAERER